MSKEDSPRSWFPRILISIAVLGLFLIILAAIAVAVLNSQWFRQFAESTLTENTGRQVTIGSLDVNPGRILILQVRNLSITNPPWAADPYLASIEHLETGIDLIQLLTGDVRITNLQVTAPRIHLERSGQGHGSWEIADTTTGSGEDQPVERTQEEDTGLPRIESLTLNDGRLTYEDSANKTSLDLTFQAKEGTSGIGKPGIFAEGGGQFAGEEVNIELSATPTPLATDPPEETVQVSLHLAAPQTAVQIKGMVDALLSPETADIQVRLQGENLSRWNEAVDTELPALPTYHLAGNLKLDDGIWIIENLKATVKDSDLAGTLTIHPEANPVRIEGDLSSTRLDVAQLQQYFPQQEEENPASLAEKAGNFLHTIAHPGWQTRLTYRADLIETGALPVRNTDITLNLAENSLVLEPISVDVAGNHIKGEAQISVQEHVAKGRIQIHTEQVSLPQTTATANDSPPKTNRRDQIPGTIEVQVAMEVQTPHHPDSPQEPTEVHGQGEPIHAVDLSTLVIENFDIHYEDYSSNTQIHAQINQHTPDRMIVTAEGKFRDTPLNLTVTGPSIESLIAPPSADDMRKHLSADLKLADTSASLSATVKPAWPPMWMDLAFSANSESPAAIARLIAMDMPALGPISLKGKLVKRSQTWTLKTLTGVVGKSNFVAQAIIETGNRTQFTGKLHAGTLDVASLIRETGNDTSHTPQSTKPGQGGIQIPDWLIHLEGILDLTVERLVIPNMTLQDVSLLSKIENGLLRIAPLTVELGEGTITTTALIDLRDPSLPARLQTDIQEVNLDKAMQTLGKESGSLGSMSGRLAFSFPSPEQNMKNPLDRDRMLERLRIDEVRIRYDDPALQARTDLQVKAESVASGIQVSGTVEYRGNPVDVRLSTGSLQKALTDYQSMPVEGVFSVNDTTIGLDAKVGNVIPFSAFKGQVWVKGPNPARLGDALGILLPHLPPYKFEALVHRKQGPEDRQTVSLQNLNGTVGDSDIAGTLHVITGGERPMISARLHTRKLDFDDLAGLIGAPPDPEETASEKQEARAEAAEDRQTLLPDKPMDFTQLRKLDAEVEYRATDVLAPDLPLNDFALNMTLEDGHMQMDRLDFGVATGTVSMQLDVNANEAPVRAKLRTDFDQINLSRLLARFDVADDSFGNIGGRALLWMRGESLAEWFGSADGGLFLTMTGGKMDALLIELAGLDFIESAAVFLSTDSRVKIECGYTDLQARSGIVTIRPLLLDTGDTKFKGHGTIDLRQEKIDLTVKPYPQDFTILSSRGPLHVTGTFMNPNFGVDPTFPSPEFGTAEDSARCSGMIQALRDARKAEKAHTGS